jgi:asparagine synthase (glutamine-hydrolysing)
VSRLTREHVTVVLNGDGGDELFAGYWRHARPRLEAKVRGVLAPVAPLVPAIVSRAAPRSRRAGLLPLTMTPSEAYASKHAGLLFDRTLKQKLYSDGFAEICRTFDPADRFRRYYERCPSSDPLDKALYVDLKTSLTDGILVKVDRTSMAHGLEVRSPLLDHSVVEFAVGMPSGLKLRGRRAKHILAEVAADRVPAAVLERPKHGLTIPLARWLRKEWRDIAEDCLFGPTAVERGWFQTTFVRSLWNTHLAGRDMYAHHLWLLVTLELWSRQQASGYQSDTRSSGAR